MLSINGSQTFDVVGEMINKNSLKREYPLVRFGMEPANRMVWQEGWMTQDLNVLAALEATQGRIGRPAVSDCILQIAGKKYRATFNIQLDPISENNSQPQYCKEIPKNHIRRNVCYKKQKTFSEKFKEFVKNIIKDNTDIIPFNCCQCTSKSGTGNTFKRKIQQKFHYKRSHPGKILSGVPCVAEGDKESKTALLNENRECIKDLKKPVSNNSQDVNRGGCMSTVCSTRKTKETHHNPVENNAHRRVNSETTAKKHAMIQTEFSDDLSEVEIVGAKTGTENTLPDDCNLPACDMSSEKNEVIVIRDMGDECQSSPYYNSQESLTGSKLDELCYKDDPTKETSNNGSCDEQRCPVLTGTYNDEQQVSERNKVNSKTKRRKGKCTCYTNKESSKEAEVNVFVLDKSEITRNDNSEKQGGPFAEQTLGVEMSTENMTAERQDHKPVTNENPFFQENKKTDLNSEQRRNKICEYIAELTSIKSKERTKKNLKKIFDRLIKNHNEELTFINRSKLNSEKLAHIKRRLENNKKPGMDEFNDHFLLIRTKDKNLKQIRKNGEINKKNDNVEFLTNYINKESIEKLEEKNVRGERKSQLEEICYLIMSCDKLKPRKCYREMFQYQLESALLGSNFTSKNTYRIVKETEEINEKTSCGLAEATLIRETPGGDWRSSAGKGRKAWAVKSRKTKTLSCKALGNQVSKDGAKSAVSQKGRGTKRSINNDPNNTEFNKKNKKQIRNHKMGAAFLSKHNKLSNDINKKVKLKCTKLYRRNVEVQRKNKLNRWKFHAHNHRLIKKNGVFALAARSIGLATSNNNSEENGSEDQTETRMNVKDGGRKAKNQEERSEGHHQVDEEKEIIDSESQDSSEYTLPLSGPPNIVFSEELELGQVEAGKHIPPNISRKLSLDSSISTSYFLRKTDGMPVPRNYVDVDAESSYTSLWLKRIRRISSLDKKLNEVLNERKKNDSRKEPSGTCLMVGAEESQVTVKCTQPETASEATTKASGRRVSFNIESPSDSSLSSYVLSDGGTVLEGLSKLKGEVFLQKDRKEYLEECVETQWLQRGQGMDQESVLNKDSLRSGTKSRISPNKLKEEKSKIRVDKVDLSPERQQIYFVNKRSKSKTLLPNNASHLQYVSVRNNEYTKPRCDLDSGIELSQSSKVNREMPQSIYTKNKKYNETMRQPAGVKYKPIIRRNVVRSISHAEFDSLVNRFNSSSSVPQCPEISEETIDEEPLDWRSQSSRSCPLEIHDSYVQSEKGPQGCHDEFTPSFPKFCTLRSLPDKLSLEEPHRPSYNVDKCSKGNFQIFPAFTDNREINRPSCSQNQCTSNNASLMKVLEALKDDQISASIKPSGDVYKILLEGNDLNSNWHIQKADGNIIVLAQHTAEGNGAQVFSREGNVLEDGEQTTNRKKYCRPCGKSDGDLQKNHGGLKKRCCPVEPVDSCSCCLACPRDGMRDQEETSENKHPNSSGDSCTCCPACPREEYNEQKGTVNTKYDLECIDACCCCEACPRDEGVGQQNKEEIIYNYSAGSVDSCICCQCSVDDQQNSPDESLNILEQDDSQSSYKLHPHGQVAKCCQLKSKAPCCDACPCCDQDTSKRKQDSQLEIKEGRLEKRSHTKTNTEKPIKEKQQFSHKPKTIKNSENSCQCCEACPKKSENLEEQKRKSVTTNKSREIENITDSSDTIQVDKDAQEESSSTNSEPIDNLPRKTVKIQQKAQKPKKSINNDSENNCLCCEACPSKNYAQQERMPKENERRTQPHASKQVENDVLDESNSTISEEWGNLPRKTVAIQKLKKQPRNDESENNCKCCEACPKKNNDLREDSVEQHKATDKPTTRVHFPNSQERTVDSENTLINEHKVKKELNSSKAVQIELSAETIQTKKDSELHIESKMTKASEKTCTCCEACPKQTKDQKDEGVQVGTSDTSNRVPENENLINPEPKTVGALGQISYENLQSASKTVIEPNEKVVNETVENQIIEQEPKTSRKSTRLTELLEELLMQEGKISDRNDSLVQSVTNSRISQLLEELVRETVKIQLNAQEPSTPISKNEPTKICLCGTRGMLLPIKADETQNPTQFQTNTYLQQSKESQNYMQYVPNSRIAEPVEELHQERVQMQQYSQVPTNTQRNVITTNMCLCCEACPRASGGARNMEKEELDKPHRPVGEVEKTQWNAWDRQHVTQPPNSPAVVTSVSDTYQPGNNPPYNHQPQVETMAFENRSIISGRSLHPPEHSMIKDYSQESSPEQRNPPNVIPLHYVEDPLELDKKRSSSRIVQNRVNSDSLSTQEISSNKHNEGVQRYPSRENEISNEANKPIILGFSHLTNKSEEIEEISAENDKQPIEEGHPPTTVYSARVMSQNRIQNNITHHNKEPNGSNQMGKKRFQEGFTKYSTVSHDSEIEILAPLDREISSVGQKYIRIDESTRLRRRYEYPEERCARGTRSCVSEGFDVRQYPEIIRVRKIYDKEGRIACAKEVMTPHPQKQAIIIQDTPDNPHKYKNESRYDRRSMEKQEHRRTPVIIRHPDMPPTLYKCAYRKPRSQTIYDGGHVSRESSYSCGTNSTTILVTPVFHQAIERRRKHGWRGSYSVMDHLDGDHEGSREHKVAQQPREVSSVDKCFCGAEKETLEALERGEDPPGGPCVCSQCPN